MIPQNHWVSGLCPSPLGNGYVKNRYFVMTFVSLFRGRCLAIGVNNVTCLIIFFVDFPIYLQSVYIHSNTISKLFVGKRGRVEEFYVAPFRDKKGENLVWLSGKRVQTKENTK
jgi:hypothetical protein